MQTLLSVLSGWVRRGQAAAPLWAHPDQASPSRANDLAYPPIDPGIPFRPVADILSHHADLISRIKLAYGAGTATFDRDLLSLIKRYAAYVHLVPATADNYFSSPGGLLRMGLETGFFSLQATDGQIFSGRSTISIRRQLEPRWRQATFIAGLCHEVHRTLSQLIVTDHDGEQWQAFLMPLADWLAKRGRDRYFVKSFPTSTETRSLGVFALPHIATPELLQHLSEGNTVIVPQLMSSICGDPDEAGSNIIGQLVRRCAALVIDRDLRASAERHGRPLLGSHLDRYLVDAMRRLIASNPAWQPNSEKSRLWFSGEGLFLVWPNAAIDILKLLEGDQLPGLPKSADALLKILVTARMVEPHDAAKEAWQIHPPPGRTPIDALRIRSPSLLLPGIDALPHPITASLLNPTPNSPTANERAPCGAAEPEQRIPATSTPAKVERQLSIPLTIRENASAPASTAPSSPTPDSCAPGSDGGESHVHRTVLRLRTPHRMNPLVAGALQDIVATLNRSGTEQAARVVARGLFVPLEKIEQRHVDPGMAVRALAELQMLAPDSNCTSKTVVHDFGGVPRPGVVIAAKFIAGLDPVDSLPAMTAGD
jgi:conjugal transfer pilus assembly protein TraI